MERQRSTLQKRGLLVSRYMHVYINSFYKLSYLWYVWIGCTPVPRSQREVEMQWNSSGSPSLKENKVSVLSFLRRFAYICIIASWWDICLTHHNISNIWNFDLEKITQQRTPSCPMGVSWNKPPHLRSGWKKKHPDPVDRILWGLGSILPLGGQQGG